MAGKRRRSSRLANFYVEPIQAKANRLNRFNLLKSKRLKRLNNEKTSIGIPRNPNCHGQSIDSSTAIRKHHNEILLTSTVNEQGRIETVSVEKSWSDGLSQYIESRFQLRSKNLFPHRTASSSKNHYQLLNEAPKYPTESENLSSNVNDRPVIIEGARQLINHVTMVDHLRRYYQIHTLGGLNVICFFCGARMWHQERVDVTPKVDFPVFSLCRKQEMIQLPLPRPTPPYLDQLLNPQNGSLCQHFKNNIRVYNSLFQFTSLGGRIENSINNGTCPYIFRLNGQTHHKIGSLLPLPGQNARFAQLYIYDTTNEVSNRISAVCGNIDAPNINKVIVQGILAMFNEVNEIAKVFRIARDRCDEEGYIPMRLRLLSSRRREEPNYTPPVGSEIAALIVGDIGMGNGDRDVIVEHRNEGLKKN